MKLSTLLPLALTSLSAATTCYPPKDEVGAVFALTNAAADNKVISFSRNARGLLVRTAAYSTTGHGQGVDFDSQGGLTLSRDRRFLYAVSPASDLVSVFAVRGSCLSRVQTVYGGDQPLSISLSSTGYAYVLTGSVASTGILGFSVDQKDGTLTPLTNETIPLSSPIGVPGVVTFSPDGRSLVVTNKVGSTLDVFSVDEHGKAAGPVTTIASSGVRPFSAAFNNGSLLYVAESGLPSLQNSALSSYRLNSGSAPSLTAITHSERNDQTDSCWVVVTPDERYAYTANFVSGSISTYRLAENGSVTLLDGAAALPGGKDSQPVDLALSGDGKYLYNLLRGAGAVAGYEIQEDGSLKEVGGVFGKGQGLPAFDGASGLAAF